MPSYASPTLPAAFRRLAWSNLAAQSAEQIALAASPIIAVLAFGADEGEAGLLQVAQTLPFVLFAIPIGLLADRVSRPGLMAGAEALRVVSLVAIIACAAGGWLNLPVLALLGFVGACGTVGYSVAAPALVPALVRPQQLPAANSRIELARTVAFMAGPALGGALVGWAGVSFAFGCAAALSVAAVLLLLGVREPGRPAAVLGRQPLRDIAEGARFVFTHPLLRPIFVTQIVFNTAFFVVLAVFVPYAVRHLGLSAAGIGIVLAAYGAGMIAGALLSPRLVHGLRFGTVLGLGPVAGFAASAVLALTIWLPWPWLAGFGWLLLGIGPIQWTISTTTLRQLVTPADLLGRVSAINITSYGARPLGAAIGAGVGAVAGAETALLLAAFLFLAQAAMVWVSPLVRLKERPAMAA
ncbi:MFS transporter [Enterovirga aerilata]|uniref:MFS transporter n=1 Tax=Enterovirga aerilata TaxID=2730920 RepID=UPI001FEDDBB4|nr:MFS transporter [Enterovirga sp. DB1703]